MDDFTKAYCEAALFSTNDESDPETGGEPLDKNYDIEDIAPEAMVQIRKDCKQFQFKHRSDIESWEGEDSEGQAGYDFWLTRNGHGAGFWDGDWSEPAATRMDTTSKSFGECHLLIGDDNLIYIL